MPSRSSALSSATTIRRARGVARCSVVEAMADQRRRGSRRRLAATFSVSSTRWRGSWRKPTGLSRSTRRCSRRSAARWAGSSAPSGRSGPDDGGCAASARGTRATARREFEALSERIVLAPGEGLPGRVLATRRAGLDHRRARGRELPARGRRPPQRACTPRSASRCGARGASSASWSSSPASCASPTSSCWRRWTRWAARSASSSRGRQAEEEVRASESRLWAMLEAALDAVVTMDRRGRVIGWNHAAEAIFGYARARGDRARHGRPDRPAARCATRTARGWRASSRPGSRVVLDRRLELTGMRRTAPSSRSS